MYLKLAWRNMWRSRRRTLITVSSIFFAVVFAILMRTAVVGIFNKLIADTVSMSSGYIQIHHTGYWANKTLDSSFEQNPKLAAVLDDEKDITAWAPRLESFALASNGEHTKGIMVTGINPTKENNVSGLAKKLVSGEYVNDSDKSIIIAQGLAEYLKLKVNDTIVLIGQGYQGSMAAGKYAVKGIVKLGIPEMNKAMAWLPMAGAMDLLGTGTRYTSISLLLGDRNKLAPVKQSIESKTTGSGYEVMTWQEMLPELDQFFQAKMAQNVIMSGILYLVVAFGIFGTILMMLNERMYEFGILVAIGMKKGILSAVVVLELVIMAIAGTVLGIAGVWPIVLYMWYHPYHLGGDWGKAVELYNIEPILQPSLDPSNFVVQGYAVFLIAITLSLYAIFKIHKLKVISAINS